jgi:hypothetical protein
MIAVDGVGYSTRNGLLWPLGRTFARTPIRQYLHLNARTQRLRFTRIADSIRVISFGARPTVGEI